MATDAELLQEYANADRELSRTPGAVVTEVGELLQAGAGRVCPMMTGPR